MAAAESIAAVRRFSRFYTRELGLLRPRLLASAFTLTEGRVLYELAHRDKLTAAALASDLNLDQGYLSRILRAFAQQGFVTKTRDADDRRQFVLSLTAKGRKAFAPLDRRSQEEIGALLGRLDDAGQQRVVSAMATIERLLSTPRARQAYRLRPHRPGDIGWIIAEHGAVYTREYGWDGSFEALVAEIAAQFIKAYDPARERCWIADIDGAPVGSVVLARASDEVAKLRLLIVSEHARGLGIGEALVRECITFARQAGYKTITLWTQSILTGARKIYRANGFRLTHSEPHHLFGVDLVSETWELDLNA